MATEDGAGNTVDPQTLAALRQLQSQYTGPDSSAGNKAEPKVYLGRWSWSGGYEDHAAQAPNPGVTTLESAKNNFFAWSPSEQQAWANKLYRAGIINDPGNQDAALQQWFSAVEFAASQYTYGKKRITPWDVMQDRLGLSQRAGNGNRGPRTTVSTSTAVQALSQGDADVMIKAIYQNTLGRDPDKGELSRYRSMLINKVKANPQTTKTTTTVDASGNSTSKSSTSGGVSQGELQNIVQSGNEADPEWGAYQAATTYMGALESLLGGNSPDLTNG